MNSSENLNRAGPSPKKRNSVANILAPYLFISPFIISFFIFFVFPAAYSLFLSFHSYRGFGEARFVGLDNYRAILSFPVFWQSVQNTFIYFAGHFIPTMVISFALALLFHSKLLGWMNKIVKPLVFLPQITAVVASALIWRTVLGRSGVVNQLLGFEVPFLTDFHFWGKISIVILITWRAIGWYMVVFLAGLTTISEELTDAAKVDGAKTWQTLYYITIPLMRPIFMFAFMINAIGAIRMFAEPNILFTQGGAGAVTPHQVQPVMNVLVSNINGGQFGMAAATGWIIFIMIFTISMIQFKLFSRKRDRDD